VQDEGLELLPIALWILTQLEEEERPSEVKTRGSRNVSS
jgi:hypothetical protein